MQVEGKGIPIAMAALWVDFQKFASKAQEEGVIENETEKGKPCQQTTSLP